MKKPLPFFIISCVVAGALAIWAVAQTGGAASGTSGTGSTATGTSGTGATGTGATGGTGGALGNALSGAASQLENVVIRYNGKLYHMQNNRPQPITHETTLPNGMKVDQSGQVTTQDGRTMTVQDGQMLTPNGQISNAPQNILNRLPGGGTGTGASGEGTGGAGGGSTSTGTSGTGGTTR